MEQNQYEVFPIVVDHIRVQDSEYNRVRNGATTNVKTKVYTFYLKVKYFEFERPQTKSAFQGQDDEIINRYKDLTTEVINGETVITNKTIRSATCPEDLKDYLKEDGKFESPYDGRLYRSYGEWLATMGTEGCDDDTIAKGCRGVVFGNLPLSDGKQRWRRMNPDGTPMKRQKSGMQIIQQTTDVCAILVYRKGQWTSMYGDAQKALEHEVSQQVSRGLWRLIDDTLPVLEEPANETPAEEENTGD